MKFTWTDADGHPHEVDEKILLGLQSQLDIKCPYLLPCGTCTVTADLKRCCMLHKEVRE